MWVSPDRERTDRTVTDELVEPHGDRFARSPSPSQQILAGRP